MAEKNALFEQFKTYMKTSEEKLKRMVSTWLVLAGFALVSGVRWLSVGPTPSFPLSTYVFLHIAGGAAP